MNRFFTSLCCWALCLCTQAQSIPLPEHPRPDFERADWRNLNGAWDFRFDAKDEGLSANWQNRSDAFPLQIQVPFPWGSALSGAKDEADVAWYRKSITVPAAWSGKRCFLVVGASDWETTVWLDGHLLGQHRGGYTPFEVELTPFVQYDRPQRLVIRVDDKRRDFTLYGKQGYGNARGLWQTVYLEARSKAYMETVHFSPDIDRGLVTATINLPEKTAVETPLVFNIKTPQGEITHQYKVAAGKNTAVTSIPLPNARLWTLEDPYLYEVAVNFGDDRVNSYFGMRKISVTPLPGANYPYIALNNQPVYLQLTLDQSYHPEGFYTFPSDAFMKNEIQLCKDIGLNGIRTHIKVDIPRKLYWADKLGLLVMSDLPNSWGAPDADAQAESEFTLREMIKRDFNHPAIFSWIVFNETWGLHTPVEENGQTQHRYLPTTQHWVVSMYHLAKSLDPTRLVEDNSICCGRGHTETDINSWHEYLPGWRWEEHLKKIDQNTFAGSPHHFESGYQQGHQPNINSECGNVWGYEGSTGDVDWSWDYHRMMNTFRKYPRVAGWLYTEHHDVINEWNGYWRFDRTKKFSGLGDIVPGMTDRDFHAPFYLSTGNDICLTLQGAQRFDVPLILSVMSGKTVPGNALTIAYEVAFTDKTGETRTLNTGNIPVAYSPWMQQTLPALSLTAPDMAGLGVVKLVLKQSDGAVLHHNFFHFVVKSAKNRPNVAIFEVKPKDYTKSEWSDKSWQVMDGLKVNGAGKGALTYHIPVDKAATAGNSRESYVLFEASAKQLFDKDKAEGFDKNQDYMLGARVSPHKNPNAYPMTDEQRYPSEISVWIDGRKVHTQILPDDPADHRGVLSWHNQLKDMKLREAGSYGYLVKVPVSRAVLQKAAARGYLDLQIRTEGTGGLAIYGEDFGRYPLNPELVIVK